MIKNSSIHRLSVAPMMEWTDRHERYFLRCISKRTVLYSEMVISTAIIKGDRDYLLAKHPDENPVVLQLGGSNTQELGEAAKIGASFGYDEINFNVGCPSDRVQQGRFGACLMAEPDLVAECVAAMKEQVDVPVTVKTRLGIDDADSDELLHAFIEKVASAGCEHFILHARKAWLQGLSPKENREIPPLQYERVYRVKEKYPELTISINGGITSLLEAREHLQQVDGVMIGREAYHNPYMMAEADRDIYGEAGEIPTRFEVLDKMIAYIEEVIASGGKLHHVTRHMLGLFNGVPGARMWRRHISENVHKPEATTQVLLKALEFVSR